MRDVYKRQLPYKQRVIGSSPIGPTQKSMDGFPSEMCIRDSVSGIPSVAVKCVDSRRNTSGEGGLLGGN